MSRAAGDLLTHFDEKEAEGEARQSYNIAPTQDVPIIIEKLDEGSLERRLLIARWGWCRLGRRT
jgi:putative SOS response-associated peptidase YedK